MKTFRKIPWTKTMIGSVAFLEANRDNLLILIKDSGAQIRGDAEGKYLKLSITSWIDKSSSKRQNRFNFLFWKSIQKKKNLGTIIVIKWTPDFNNKFKLNPDMQLIFKV